MVFSDARALIDNRPLSGFQIRALVLVGLLVFMDGFDVQMIGFVAPALLRDWHLSVEQLGPIFAAGLLGMLLGSTSLGMLADRVGRRPVLIGATAFVGACVMGTAATHSVTQLLALRFLTGLGLGGVLGNAVTLASEYCPSARRAFLLMAISCGFTAGAICGGLLSALLIPRAGWQSVFIAGGVLPMGVVLLSIRALPESLQLLLVRGASRERIEYWLGQVAPDAVLSPKALMQHRERTVHASVADLFRANLLVPTLLLWVVSFANLLNLFFLANWLPTLATRMGFTDSQGVLLGTTLQGGGIVGALLLGRLIDKVGFYKVLGPSFLIGAGMVVFVGRALNPVALECTVIFIAGICIVGGQPGINALATSIYPVRLRATGVGWCLGIGRAGSIVGPLVAARLIANHFTNKSLFMVASVPAILSAVAILTMALKRRLPSPAAMHV